MDEKKDQGGEKQEDKKLPLSPLSQSEHVMGAPDTAERDLPRSMEEGPGDAKGRSRTTMRTQDE